MQGELLELVLHLYLLPRSIALCQRYRYCAEERQVSSDRARPVGIR